MACEVSKVRMIEIKEGKLIIEVEPDEMRKIETDLNGFLETNKADPEANHYDIIDILERNNIVIRNGVVYDSSRQRN